MGELLNLTHGHKDADRQWVMLEKHTLEHVQEVHFLFGL